MILPMILSGGSGTRLWPASRRSRPKQLLPLLDERTMLRATIDRLNGIPELRAPLVIANVEHRDLVASQLRAAGFEPPHMILEPFGRNTAPAVAAAAIELAARGEDPVLLVLPADHVISDEAAFKEAVVTGTLHAEAGRLVTFGIVPSQPETGYGYIHRGEPVEPGAYRVDAFVEKPDAETAASYIASGNHFWNSGMFMFLASRYMEELETHTGAIAEATRQAVSAGTRDESVLVLDSDSFSACPSDSIDFAVMEYTEDGVMIPLDAGWNDVGSWQALWEIVPKDESGNALVGDVVAIDAEGSYVRSEGRLVTVAGIRDLVVIATPDAVLVVPRDRAQDVKNLVDRLTEDGRPEPNIGEA